MSEGTSLINLGELSKPMTVLIEKISGTVGTLYEPTKIRRLAKAEADAALIEAKSKIEVSDLMHRAMLRWVQEEERKQENIETITAKALPLLAEDAKPNQIEDDWITQFFDKCRIVSDQEMQLLWSKVLATEANGPGTFSKRTLAVLANLDKKDAESFQTFCSFVWNLGYVTPLIYAFPDSIYTAAGISLIPILELESLGLINVNQSDGYSNPGMRRIESFSYFGTTIEVQFPNGNKNPFDVGKAIFTDVGRQLFRVCDASPIPGFYDYCVAKWQGKGLKVTPV